MKITRKTRLIIGMSFASLLATWFAYAHTSTFHINTALLEANYPRGSSSRPNLATRLRLVAGFACPNSRSISDLESDLASYGIPAIPSLTAVWKTGPAESDRCLVAAGALLKIGIPAVDTITTVMLDPSVSRPTRLQAALLLRNLAGLQKLDLTSTSAAQALVQLSQPDQDPCLRYAAIHSLALVNPPLALQCGIPIVSQPRPTDALERWYWSNALYDLGPATAQTRDLMETELTAHDYFPDYVHWARTHALAKNITNPMSF